MPYSTFLQGVLTSVVAGELGRDFRTRIEPQLKALFETVVDFLEQPVSAVSTAAFEKEVALRLRELGRQVVETTYNQIEPSSTTELPSTIRWEAVAYRPVGSKTPNRYVASLFGTLTLWRHGYRSRQRDDGEPLLFPLEQALGLRQGATPALAERVGLYLAEAGATQRRVLGCLQAEHGVCLGVKRLRALAESLAADLTPHRQTCQVERVLELLEQAFASRGRYRPSLCAGRDGITLGQQPHGFFEVASTATLSVYDRRGRRLGTVSLAYTPEFGQSTMTRELTGLLKAVLQRWQGQLPRLCYVTDAGDNETTYYRRVLRRLRHPRSGEKLEWSWIVDYYHAAERLTVLAEAVFGSGGEAQAWARKMRKLLLKPAGVRRVLHSAAALRARRGVRAAQKQAFRRAYNYLRDRAQHMRYADFRRVGLPIGSGVTEAACKTVFTQRLKLSGMRWKEKGAQVILDLRVILLSGIWARAYEEMLKTQTMHVARSHADFLPTAARKAA
jgi:hypothetical protein